MSGRSRLEWEGEHVGVGVGRDGRSGGPAYLVHYRVKITGGTLQARCIHRYVRVTLTAQEARAEAASLLRFADRADELNGTASV